MSNSPRTVFARATLVAVAATATLATLGRWLGPTIDLDPGQPFAALLAQWSAVVLLGCAAWGWLVTAAILIEAVRASIGSIDPDTGPRSRGRGVAAAYRRLVLGACGVALAAGSAAPAMATPGPVHLAPRSAAAAVPAAVPVTPPTSGVGSHGADPDDIVVHRGDSLWRLAAERLPQDASNATIAHTWRRLYAANESLIGADPDHLEPGQRLARPRVW